MKSFTYTVKDQLGLHARPAGLLATKSAAFTSNITLSNGIKEVDCKKLIRLLTLGIKQGDQIEVKVDGADEEAAFADIQTFIQENL